MRAALLALTALCGCTGAIGAPVEAPRSAPRSGAPDPTGPTTPSGPATPRPTTPPLPAASTCRGAPLGRSYVSVLGGAREADRADIDVGLERDIPVINAHWYQFEIEQKLYDIFDSYPHYMLFTPEGVVGTFNGVRPERTFSRIIQGPLTPVKLFEISFRICLLEIESRRGYSLWDDDRYRAPPTPAGARAFCQRLLDRALDAPTAEDVDSCVEFATVDAADDPVAERQWAYVCGMIGATTAGWTR